MLYYNFNNYEGFKERFGVRECGNGVKVRTNKILLSYVKQPELLRKARISGDTTEINISSMTQLWSVLRQKVNKSHNELRWSGNFKGHELWFDDMILQSNKYSFDELGGICEDGDIRQMRYVNLENNRVFKKKAGRLMNDILTEYGISWPEPVRLWFCEEFSRKWETYAASNKISKTGELELFVDDNFRDIYASAECDGDFDSCMVDDEQWTFYRDAVNASAAYLRSKATGLIVARCIIFNEVEDEDTGEILRLAERQYTRNCDDVNKRLLIDALIKGKYIDGYKKVGVSCHANNSYVGVDGSDWSHRHFSIECNLEDDDTLSYQDSFVYYDMNEHRAYNYATEDACECLNDTCSYFHAPAYDSWNERYTTEELYEVYYHGNRYETDYDTREYNFREIDGEWHHKDDCVRCPHCGDWMLKDDEDYYSELTGESYCSAYCRDNAENEWRRNNMTYSEYDDEYFEDEDDVTEYKKWCASRYEGGVYYTETISLESLAKLIDKEEVIYCNGMYYELPYTKEWDILHWHFNKVYND